MIKMENNNLLLQIKKALDSLVINFYEGKIDEETLLKNLNEAAHYSKVGKNYLYEMFFIQANELDKLPKSPLLVSLLFKDCTIEDFVLNDRYLNDGTRMNVLRKLNLRKSIKLYELFLLKEDEEAHIHFKEGIHNVTYIESRSTIVTLEDIRNIILEEMN
jgi:hypothetical protein